MGEFLKILLSLSFSGTFLFLIVFLVVRLCRNRLSRRWQYYIWLLVIFRFLIPLTLPHTMMGYLFRNGEQVMAGGRIADQTEDAAAGKANSSEDTADKADITDSTADKTGYNMEDNTGGQRAVAEAKEDSETLTVRFQEKTGGGRIPGFPFFLFGIWAVGALILLIRKITIYQNYMRFLRKGNEEVSDLETLNLLAGAEEGLGIKRMIELYRNPLITSPIMTGFLRPKIVIPDKKMTDRELSCIFMHELVHFKYFDMFYKWLVQITICVHWFNPFVYLLGKEVNKRCELSCDEKVIAALNEQERKSYGDTLLSFLKRGETYQNPLASVTMTEGAEQLIERLGAIMDYRKKSKTIMILTTVLTVLLCFFFSGIGAYAGAREGQRSVVDGAKKGEAKNDEGLGNDKAEEKEWENDDYSLLYDEEARTYYIFVDGATMADRPTGSGVDSIGIVLVRKSGYTTFSFASYELKFGFLDKVESQCQDALKKGVISEAEAETILDVAAQIAAGEDGMSEEDGLDALWNTEELPEEEEEQESVGRKVEELKKTHYSYFQQAHYREPYIIEFGWNLGQEAVEVYAHTEVLLNDQSRMTVYFSKEAEKWMEDEAAMEAVSRLTSELKPEARSKYGIKLELPYVSRIVYLPSDEIEDFAKRAFERDELADFAAVVEMLPEEAKVEYCERSHEKDDIAFFSIIISEMNADHIREFMERYYESDEIDYFSVAADNLSKKDRKDLMEKALQEGNEMYYYMLKDKEDWDY